MPNLALIPADWSAPSHVQAWVTTRKGGVSKAPWDSLNLGTHVNDNADDVAENRQRLQTVLQRISPVEEGQWLKEPLINS